MQDCVYSDLGILRVDLPRFGYELRTTVRWYVVNLVYRSLKLRSFERRFGGVKRQSSRGLCVIVHDIVSIEK